MADLYTEIANSLPELAKLVFSQPADRNDVKNITFRPIQIRGKRCYQTESIRDNKAFHTNYSEEELLAYCREKLIGRYRQVLVSTQLASIQFVLNTRGGYKRTSHSTVPMPGGKRLEPNREKSYILAEGEQIPALVDLGIFTPDYMLIKAKSDKFRQINRFVELVDHAYRETQETQITILDFGCGKSYLTFILYYYFAVKRGMNTTIIGYDLKADVVAHCNEIAAKYGYDRLRFEVADVTKDKLFDEKIDMVVTLHACDTATDYALWYAVQHGAKKIFSVPCCQHEINSSISTSGGDLDLLLRYGIIKERTSALLTDAIRASVLEDLGYSVDMIEFIDFEHSPKNLMIRASLNGKKGTGHMEEAQKLADAYGFRQKLLELASESENK